MSKQQLQKEIEQEYLAEFTNKSTRNHDRHRFINNEHSFQARGIKSLQQPSVYILSIIIALCLYQLDRSYDFRRIYREQSSNLDELKNTIKSENQGESDSPALTMFTLSVLILSSILAFKRVSQKNQADPEEIRAREQRMHEREIIRRQQLMGEPANACEKITEEEFDYQANATTKREIQKLVNSQSYKEAQARKGLNQSAWNWQAYERDQGIIPDGEEREIEGFDLVGEMDRIDVQVGLTRPRPNLQYRISRHNISEEIPYQKSLTSQSKGRKSNDPLSSPTAKNRINQATPSTHSSIKQFTIRAQRTSEAK